MEMLVAPQTRDRGWVRQQRTRRGDSAAFSTPVHDGRDGGVILSKEARRVGKRRRLIVKLSVATGEAADG